MDTLQKPSGTLPSPSPDLISPQPTFHFYFREPSTVRVSAHRPPIPNRFLELVMFHFDASVVELNEKDGTFKLTCVGPNIIGHDQQLQHTVAPNVLFGLKDYDNSSDSALSKSPARDAENHYSLVGCTCALGFHYEELELVKRSGLISL